jgi:hypothetical protein
MEGSISFPQNSLSMAYLGSWALVAPIITTRFLLDSHPLLLKVIGARISNIFPIQAHLKSTCKLLPLDVVIYVPPFV